MNLLLGLTQSHGNTTEVSSNSTTAAAVSLADPTLIKGVGGKQNSVTADWLEREEKNPSVLFFFWSWLKRIFIFLLLSYVESCYTIFFWILLISNTLDRLGDVAVVEV